MKIKIKINEATKKQTLVLLSEVESETEISDDDTQDIEKVDKEAEASADRKKNLESLERLLATEYSPDKLPIVAQLIAAHREAINKDYNLDGLWEKIKIILSNSKQALAVIQNNPDIPGIRLDKLVNTHINLAAQVEDEVEEITSDDLLADIVSEDLEAQDLELNKKINQLIKKKEEELGRELTEKEKYTLLLKFNPFDFQEKRQALTTIQSLLRNAKSLTKQFNKNLEASIAGIGKNKQDPAKTLIKNPNLVRNLKGLFIVFKVTDTLVEKIITYMSDIVKSKADALRSEDPKDVIDGLSNAKDNYGAAYKSFTPLITDTIMDASNAFDKKIYRLAVIGQDRSIGSPTQVAKDQAEKLAGQVDVGLDENIINEEYKPKYLDPEDIEVIKAYGLVKGTDVENLLITFDKSFNNNQNHTEDQIIRMRNLMIDELTKKINNTISLLVKKTTDFLNDERINTPENKILKKEIRKLHASYSMYEKNIKYQLKPENFATLLTKLENFSIERLKDDLQKVKKNAAIKNAAAAAKKPVTNDYLYGKKMYKVTKKTVESDKEILEASQTVAFKLHNKKKLTARQLEYYNKFKRKVDFQINKLKRSSYWKNKNKSINEVLIKENCVITNNSNVDVSQLENIVARFYPYVKEKLKFNKDAKLNFISDPENAKDPWGKTAYYNPNSMEVTIFVDGRHPKDMLRSISHELVHHAQNCRGEFDQSQALEPGYAQNDPHMRRMEGEAYLLGNGFLVRDFEDYLKSQQNQNLTENKKMKGLTNEQLRTVLENTINRITKEGFSGAVTAEPAAIEEGETDCAKLAQRIRDGLDTVNQYGQGGDVVERDSQAYQAAGCPPLDGMGNPVKEEVVEEEAKNMVDCDGKMVPEYACDGKGKDDLKENFTSKKDQLLFERLTNKWAK